MLSHVISFLLPHIAYADMAEFDAFILSVNKIIINPIIVLLFGLAVAYFLWGVFQFIANPDNDEKRTVGKSHMMYGIIGIAIMMGVFAIMNIVLDTLGIDNVDPKTGDVQLDPYDPNWP